jgi:hypothetical protein
MRQVPGRALKIGRTDKRHGVLCAHGWRTEGLEFCDSHVRPTNILFNFHIASRVCLTRDKARHNKDVIIIIKSKWDARLERLLNPQEKYIQPMGADIRESNEKRTGYLLTDRVPCDGHVRRNGVSNPKPFRHVCFGPSAAC